MDHDYIDQLDRQAEERAEAYRKSQNARQRCVGICLLLVLAITTSLATLAIRRTWHNATTGPSGRVHGAPEPTPGPSELAPGEARWGKDGELQRFSF